MTKPRAVKAEQIEWETVGLLDQTVRGRARSALKAAFF